MEQKQYDKYNMKRLQEGVVIIDPKKEEIKLLVDDVRSIMSHLYDSKTYILREYQVD